LIDDDAAEHLVAREDQPHEVAERAGDAGVTAAHDRAPERPQRVFWLALGHIVSGALLCITIIGIPLGVANFKMVPISLTPLGREIVGI
jgi:hypothetical protein